MSIHVPPDVREDLLAHFLRWANQERVTRLGLEPLDELPQGEPTSRFNCLICRSLGGSAETHAIRTNNDVYDSDRSGSRYPVPDYVCAVACAFDQGAFRELILPDEEWDSFAWSGAKEREAQQIIDRLAAEIRAQREPTSALPPRREHVAAGLPTQKTPTPSRVVVGVNTIG